MKLYKQDLDNVRSFSKADGKSKKEILVKIENESADRKEVNTLRRKRM